MPAQTPVIGTRYDVYVPDLEDLMTLGYTHIRVFQEATEDVAVGAADTAIALVAGTKDYSYNNTSGLETDWGEHCFYSVALGEGPHSTRVPLGRPRATRKLIRQGVGRRLSLMDTVAIASATTTTFIASSLIDPDVSASRFANRIARLADGALAGDIRRVRNVANTGYNVVTGEIKVNRAFGGTPAAAVQVELWKPHGDEDTSSLVDEAMNEARRWVWIEESIILSIDDQVTEYTLPDGCNEKTIAKVEWVGDTFPSRTNWIELDSYEVTGNTLSVYRESGAYGNVHFTGGDLVRVTWATMGDRMQDDADYWSASLEWCIAETALAYFDRIGKPDGQQEAIAHERAKSGVLREANDWRNVHMPPMRVKVYGPR